MKPDSVGSDDKSSQRADAGKGPIRPPRIAGYVAYYGPRPTASQQRERGLTMLRSGVAKFEGEAPDAEITLRALAKIRVSCTFRGGSELELTSPLSGRFVGRRGGFGNRRRSGS